MEMRVGLPNRSSTSYSERLSSFCRTAIKLSASRGGMQGRVRAAPGLQLARTVATSASKPIARAANMIFMTTSIFRSLSTVLIFILAAIMARPSRAQTYYTLSFPNAEGHVLEVQASFNGPIPALADVKLPVWTPGSYLIREYGRNVETLSAYSAQGSPLPCRKTDKATWQVNAGGKPFSVRYRVYCNELSVRTPYVAVDLAFLPPAAVLVYLPSLMGSPHYVAVDTERLEYKTISTPLPLDDVAKAYRAANYDELVDSPFQLGGHTEQTFVQDGCRYRLATYPAEAKISPDQITTISKVVAQANKVFGGRPPVTEYLFFSHLAPGQAGGLEHLYCSVLGGGPNTLSDPKQFEDFLTLVGHEYFHLWNVKRIRPRQLGPFDYQQENYSTTLWFAEGFTKYYEKLLVSRAGLVSPDETVARIAANISNAASVAGVQVQSLEQASFNAWINYYRPNENSPNATVSYYTNGAALGFAVDMRIRALTKGARSLDDLMRLLWLRTQADGSFYADRDAITKALSDVCGINQADWLGPLIETPSQPDYANLAIACGLAFVDESAVRFYPTIGAGLVKTQGAIVVQYVRRSGPAEKAGLQYQDVLVSLNGKTVTEVPDFEAMALVLGQPVALDVLRQGKPLSLSIPVEASTRKRYKLQLPKRDVKELKGWLQ